MQLSFDIWSCAKRLSININGCRTNGLSDQWAVGPMGCRTNGLSEYWDVIIDTYLYIYDQDYDVSRAYLIKTISMHYYSACLLF